MASNNWAPYTVNQGEGANQQDEWNQDWGNTWNDDFQSDAGSNTEWWVNNKQQQQQQQQLANNAAYNTGEQSVQYGGVAPEYFRNNHEDQSQHTVDGYGYPVYNNQPGYDYSNQMYPNQQSQEVISGDAWQHGWSEQGVPVHSEQGQAWAPGFGQAEQPAEWATVDTSDPVSAGIDVAVQEDTVNVHAGGEVSDLPLEVRPEGPAIDDIPVGISETLPRQPTTDNNDYNADNSFERSSHLEVPGNQSVDSSRVRFIIGSEPTSALHSQADTPEPGERLVAESNSILSTSYVDGPMNLEPDGAETELPGSPHSQQYSSTPASSNSVASQIMFADHASSDSASHALPQLAADFADVSLVDNVEDDRRDEDSSFQQYTHNYPTSSGHYQQDFTHSHPVYTNTLYDEPRHGRPPPASQAVAAGQVSRSQQALAGQFRQPAEGQLMINTDTAPVTASRSAADPTDRAHMGSQNSAFSPVSAPRTGGHQPSSPGQQQQHRAGDARNNMTSSAASAGAPDTGVASSGGEGQYNNFERQRSVPVGHDNHEDSRANAALSTGGDSHRTDSSQATAGNSVGGLLARPQLLEGQSSQSLTQPPPPSAAAVGAAVHRSNNAISEATTNRVPVGPPPSKVAASGDKRDADVLTSTTQQRQQLGGNEQDGRSHTQQPVTSQLSSSSSGSVDYTGRGGGGYADNNKGGSSSSLASSGSRGGREGQGQGHYEVPPSPANHNRPGDRGQTDSRLQQAKPEGPRYERNNSFNNLQPSASGQGQAQAQSGDQPSAYQRQPQSRGAYSQEEYGMRQEQQSYDYRPSSRASVDAYGHGSQQQQQYSSHKEDSRGRQMYEQDSRHGYGPPRQQQPGDRPTSRQGYPDASQQQYESNAYHAYDRPGSRSAYDRPGSRSGYDSQRSGDYTSYDRPSSRSSGYDERESRSGYRERQAYRDRSVSREEEEYYRHKQQQAYQQQPTHHAAYPPSMDRQSSRSSQHGRERERSTRHDYAARDSSVGRSGPSSDVRSSYDRPGSRSDQRGDYNAHDRSRSARYPQDSSRRQNQGFYGQEQPYGGGYPASYSDYYANYYDPRYQQQQMEQYMRGYAAEAQKYGPEYTKQVMEWYQQWNDYYERSSRGSTPAVPDYNDSAADHFAQDNGSRPSSRAGSRPASRQSNREYERYPAMGSEMDAYNAYSTQQPEAPGRHTPLKHTMPHVRASFGPLGQVVKVLPSMPAYGEPAVVIMEQLPPPLLLDREEVASFPGPLARGVTHKNDVLLFCQRRLHELRNANVHLADREGMELVWKYLELLIKQNGVMLGTDIADLLLDKLAPGSNVTAPSGNVTVADTSRLDASMMPSFAETSMLQADADVMERFRHLLLHGRRKDALEWAMKNNQWGCAFFLASKMDAKTHASVLTRFANSTMRMNDPLQTFYQLMSGRQPAAVTLAGDEKWGDWRPHLAMILSNASPKPEVDKKSIIALGDTLGGKYYTYSSHFCYLMGGMTLGSHLKKTDKLVLIGAHHGATVDNLVTPYLVQCTEVYEYARALANPEFNIPDFQLYKFLYAVKLFDAGFVDEALQYCEVVATAVAQSPYGYSEGLIQALLALGARLQGARLDDEASTDQQQQPPWVTALETAATALASQVAQQSSEYAYDGQQYQYPLAESTYLGQGQGQDGYTSQQYYTTPVEVSQSQGQHEGGEAQSVFYQENQQSFYPYSQQEQHPQVLHVQAAPVPDSYGQFGMSQDNDTSPLVVGASTYAYSAGTDIGYIGEGHDTNVKAVEAVPAVDEGLKVQDLPPSQPDKATAPLLIKAMASKVMPALQPMAQVDHPAPGDTGDSVNSTSVPAFDYYAAATGQATREGYGSGGSDQNSPNKRADAGHDNAAFQFGVMPTQYTAADPSVGLGTRGRQKWPGEDDEDGGNKTSSSSSAEKKKKTSDAAKNGEQPQTGFFGSMWNKMRGPKTHAMKLPDDSKPSIVWDAAKGRYMNSDGSEIASRESVAPPPLTASQPRAPGAAPPVRANLAKLDAKKRYVDVMASTNTLKPSPSAPASLFSVMPALASDVKPASFLMPREDRRISESQEEPEAEPQQQQAPAHALSASHPVAADTSSSRRGSNASVAAAAPLAGGYAQPAAGQGQGYAAPPGGNAQRPGVGATGAPPPALGQAAPPPLKPALGPQSVAARPAAASAMHPAGHMQPNMSAYNSNNSAQPLDMDSVDSQLSHTSSVSSMSSEVQTILQQPAAAAADQPVFFNPSQMMAGGGGASQRSGGYHPGQRRAYPR